MVQKYSDLRVLEIFFKEPTTIHFVREISRKINLAPPSVKIIINRLLDQDLIMPKNSKPFNGYVANRENDSFFFHKKAFNLLGLEALKNLIVEFIHPLAIVLFGSYSRGEDVESSDIDLLIISRVKKQPIISEMEKKLGRKINIMFVKDLSDLDDSISNKIYNGIVLQGEI